MQDPLLDPNIVGYCGLAVPVAYAYQGFLIDRRGQTTARETLATVRTTLATQPTKAKAYVELGGVAGKDQEVVAALSGTLVDCAVQNMSLHLPPLLGALRLLVGPYFLIIGHPDAEDGWRTTVERLAATTPEAARTAFREHPTVRAIDAARATQA